MSALTRVLFPLPDVRRTPWSLLRWWEQRRPIYNAFVGGAGAITLVVLALMSHLPPGAPGLGPVWRGVIAYGVLANVCYSLGWVTEVGMRALWGDEAPDAGPALFRQGLSFSIGLSLLPIPLAIFGWVLRLVHHFF